MYSLLVQSWLQSGHFYTHRIVNVNRIIHTFQIRRTREFIQRPSSLERSETVGKRRPMVPGGVAVTSAIESMCSISVFGLWFWVLLYPHSPFTHPHGRGRIQIEITTSVPYTASVCIIYAYICVYLGKLFIQRPNLSHHDEWCDRRQHGIRLVDECAR